MMKFYKRHSIFKKIKDNHNNPRQLYKIISSLVGQDNTNPLPDAQSDQELAEQFAEFFLQKIETIWEKFNNIALYKTEPDPIPQLNKFSPINEIDLCKIIKAMPSKSCELDYMGTDKIKEVLHTCLPSITKIVNLSLEKGTFSNQWKTAIVKPLIKAKTKGTAYTNYRPVSNLSFISKVVERCTIQQLTQHCNNHNLLPEFQSAYRKHHGCETSLLKLTNDILWGMENQQVTSMIILDLSAAFDTVDHELLLKVLNHRFGVTDKALEWYKNYLIPRKFKVSINGSYSSEKTINFSAPQGSVQGAFLFIAYASTIQEVVKKDLTLTGFADDHSICKQFRPGAGQEQDTIAILESSLKDIKAWMDTVRLRLNESKTEFIYFGSGHQLKKCNGNTIKVIEETINRCSTVRYLGAYLDSQLSFKEHIKTKCKSAVLNIIRIRNIRRYLDKDTTHMLIKSLALSHLDYANSLLMGLPAKTIKIMQNIQNLAAKVVLGKHKSDSSMECLKTLHWLQIKYRINYKVCTLVFKCLHAMAPPYLIKLIKIKQQMRQGL